MYVYSHVDTCIEAAALTQKYILVAPVFFLLLFFQGCNASYSSDRIIKYAQ